ncbi:MAG: DUF4399 domain-containing protein [Rhodothermales bacterium]|nr:DUF4399 domain-containing protein [Rhodothermales bacterium]MBO6780137.1 DUF4399 domain-containing protein [Rhodothermales bacterium]
MARYLPLLLLVAACTSDQPQAEPEAAEPSARVFFASPADGAELESPISVEMAAEGIDVVPAGTFTENSGHFHILVNEPFLAPGSVIPADSTHIHYGDGSSSTTLDLPPGEHVLRLQLADGAHIALEGMEDEITITVR